MGRAKWLGALCITTTLGVAGLATPAAWAAGLGQNISVGGTVSAPSSYTPAQLATLATTVQVPARGGAAAQTDEGVSLEQLVEAAQPVLPSAKNALLRVTVTVTPAFGLPVTFALGELDPNFGNHPAYVVLTQNGRAPLLGPELVVPGDVNGARTVYGVEQITVGVQSPTATTPPAAGDLTIEAGLLTSVISAAELRSLPAETLTVSFLAGGPTPQTHTETGPTLNEVLTAAHIPPPIVSWVAGVGSDDYVATVTPAEAEVGNRPLLISTTEDGVPLAQPRLITDGDVKGGRYDSDLDDLVIGYPSYLGFLGGALLG
jgi:hypothetical protein